MIFVSLKLILFLDEEVSRPTHHQPTLSGHGGLATLATCGRLRQTTGSLFLQMSRAPRMVRFVMAAKKNEGKNLNVDASSSRVRATPEFIGLCRAIPFRQDLIADSKCNPPRCSGCDKRDLKS